MIEIISSWAKSLGVTIVLVSIIEMVLPNNNTKKYIRMVLGIFVIFNIISPFINNKDKLSLASINIEDYYTEGSSNTNIGGNANISSSISGSESNKANNEKSETINQTSMDERIKQLYEDELEKDIIKKIENLGYEVSSCKVEAEVPTGEYGNDSNSSNNSKNITFNNETGISKIEIKIKGKQDENSEDNKEDNREENAQQEESLENKLVTGIQRIKEVDVSGDGAKKQDESNGEKQTDEKVTNSDIQNIKTFLIEEYGVSDKCLEIN